jgi:phage shock protein PspC (stress-responsive transcriptional regulator)
MPENRRLTRAYEGRVLTGVCAGLGRYTRVDPVVFRVGFAVLTLAASGTGVFLYVAAALLMPADERSVSVAERVFKREFDGDAVVAALGALLTVCVLFSLAGGSLGGRATGPLTAVTVSALALLVAHARGVDLIQVARTLPERFQGTPIRPGEPHQATSPAPDPANMVDLATLDSPVAGTTLLAGPRQPPADAQAADAQAAEPLTQPPLTQPSPTQPSPTQPLPTVPLPAPAEQPPAHSCGSALTNLTLLVALAAGAVTVPFTTHDSVTTRVSIAIATGLAVLGAGLIVASWYGRSRGLVSLGVVLCLALVATTAVGQLPSDGRWGDVRWRPAIARTDQSYRVIVGGGNLDLTALPLSDGQRVRVRAEVSLGELKVTVPGRVTTEVHARSSLGDVNVAGKVTSGPRARVDVVLPADGAAKRPPVIELFLRGRIGDVEVRRVPS